ncbi:uncharacterized protein CDV56_100478 [Aspergillus thermomutatus]|uniref:Uncharacterized protein n=1 Tax=Aspergillus thermomutatus TaxID=41047 RepID=A0A397GHC4_ASPTH|nr:uncharacterized protein CDV56_100478 [Aspergillus thermomutatus]RHZ47420.1 hypothetical protein CDV56_100478 [Aspergillus thermomutatus]
MHSADQMSEMLDQWDPEYEDVGTLSLDEIYQELSRLDAFEQLISSKQVKDGPDHPEKNDNDDEDDTGTEKNSEQVPVQDNPEETRKNTVLHEIDTRRLALRARAMDLSRAKIRPITIVDLPADILRKIFDYFQDPRVGKQGLINWRSRRRDSDDETVRETIRQVRLVCSLFNDLASPLLCPILRVDLDQGSLDKAVELSKSPRIAEGVRAIQVGLQYRPQELVSDCRRFKDYRKQQLGEMARSCDYYAETWMLGGYDSDDETVCPLPLRVYREAISNYYRISRSWDRHFTPDESEDVTKSEVDEHQEILLRGYNEYCKKHEEQLQLITTGSFVIALASCISQLPNARALGFTDQVDPPYDRYNPTVVLRDKSLLPGLMSAGLEWQKIEDFEDVKLTPARILFELPISIHKAGTTLRDLYIGPFPCRGSFSLICPDTLSNPTDPAAWSDLRAACSGLWRVSFGGSLNCRFIRHEHLPPGEKYYVDQYLGAILCSPDMEDAWMSFNSFGLNDGRTTKEGWYDIGPVLGAVKWPRINRLAILSVSSKQDELERFCAGLGHSMRYLQLSSIHLLNGSWAGILDTLDEKVADRFREQKATVYLSYLGGGEFGEEEVKTISIFDDSFSDLDPGKPLPAAGQLLKELHPSLFTDW